ncbi:uncharacterized protein BP01DRAFT_50006 [Aspergillus saccharolyticus JOP 1030-1]|uniref:Uncharacterized protein n=1 Tax=Aspergillus saccharolyticus JOP 1030-1 TaxID=1450539 RepID=A0A318ZDE8_9EURO|nr:hypothetical protein BP01DRAFT_50006 [Aspergillus saccharolyticus JOP 1030-1]PYH45365.1 hypothetical protein BP01DRAFT_50006 [Aspergillus saccharolyticus JOP 1030-1]
MEKTQDSVPSYHIHYPFLWSKITMAQHDREPHAYLEEPKGYNIDLLDESLTRVQTQFLCRNPEERFLVAVLLPAEEFIALILSFNVFLELLLN